MLPDSSHITRIMVVSNTHWDREFRRSFEKTRRRLLDMMDVTLDILEQNPQFHSFTMDGHCIMIDDYLEMRPERAEQVKRLARDGRLIIGPWYTLPETMSISHEALVRNFLRGRQRVEAYGGKPNTVAYTPASWGQTGQLPQILADFGLRRMMFYRGISHHESDAEFVWSAPDGTCVLASRFAIYARYNWYYQVHRAVSRHRTFEKDYVWGEYDEVPFRFADGLAGEDLAFDLKSPVAHYDKSRLKQVIEDMIKREGEHFTTEIFLAMNGHDISVAWPHEAQVIADAREALQGRYTIEHTDLEHYWEELEKSIDKGKLSRLKGERRAHLQKGMWTYLLPASISARTYLKQQDFAASTALVYLAEPLASLAASLGDEYPARYLERGWSFLMSNHTHDANGGCAPDTVCKDMETRYRAASDIADIVTEDAMTHVARNLPPAGQPADAMQLIVFNTLPFDRNVVALVDLEIPRKFNAKAVLLESHAGTVSECQPVSLEKSSAFVDNIWDVPSIIDSHRIKFYAQFQKLPALGYRVYRIVPQEHELRSPRTLVTGPNTMENEYLAVAVNPNGAVTITNKISGKVFDQLNYLTDQGECGSAWRHVAPRFDRKYNSLGASASVAVAESGPLVSKISAEYEFSVPLDYADGNSRSDIMIDLPVCAEYRLEKDAHMVKVRMSVDNRACDHWLRANFPSGLKTDEAYADSHFDVVTRPITLPDSTGWVERFEPTHPLRTFVGTSDQDDGIAIFSKGLFEYEAIDDAKCTLVLTLLRACRIKLAVSEEKQTELPDAGVQCHGPQVFEYAIFIHPGDWQDAALPNRAAEYYTPVRAAMTGRGKGNLPLEARLFTADNPKIHITCVKRAENGEGLIIRMFNPIAGEQAVTLSFGREIAQASLCRMDESFIKTQQKHGNKITLILGPKKIMTCRVLL
ncbi:MAG: glycoside hydrolase family 38 C-terminal domain-containing protein [bacterium]|nr:glycosyl hydrolase-related protein [Candidatus Sumerlaeota bacterium]